MASFLCDLFTLSTEPIKHTIIIIIVKCHVLTKISTTTNFYYSVIYIYIYANMYQPECSAVEYLDL